MGGAIYPFRLDFGVVWSFATDDCFNSGNLARGAKPDAGLLTWWAVDGRWPAELPVTSFASIIYLGVIATTIGFVLYYYLLIHLAPARVALIALVSPVMALMIGHLINHEPLTMKVMMGTSLILAALLMHEFFDRLVVFKKARL